jgi:hypothetical protein
MPQDAEMKHGLLAPLFAMIAVVFVVWVRMYRDRLSEMTGRRIHPQKVATRSQANALLERSAANDNLQNLFELPVLFYALVLLAMQLSIQDPVMLLLAWVFVAARAAHSAIHCTYNRVMHRFWMYALSSLALWAMVARMAWLVFAA